MPQLHHQDIGLLDWDTFVAELEAADWSAPVPSPFVRAVRTYFGVEEAERLHVLSRRASRQRSREPLRGNVVLVPGTLCSNLTTTHPSGYEDMLWLNLVRLALGRLDLLTLDPEGTADANPDLPIHVEGVLKYTYAVALLWLHARWQVRSYGYDWRKDVDFAADGLADFIRARFPDQPVHLVAHSMGGLVCRRFIDRHPDLWASMADPELWRGGRLVMLGSPNYGSYLATQAMSGEGALFQALNAVDVTNGVKELLAILDTFVANYQMLPSPERIPAEEQAIYQRETWGELPISATHLERAADFHQQLAASAPDAARLAYIAGYGVRTPNGLTVVRPGLFKHRFTPEGDGVTTLELGPLSGVPTWYVAASHFVMPARVRVLMAVDDLLFRGRTVVLPRAPVPGPLFGGPILRCVRSKGAAALQLELRDVAGRAAAGRAGAREIHRAERVMVARALGDPRTVRRLAELETAKAASWWDRLTPSRPDADGEAG
jgi:pimeloyl-ACP methyl ester carboxylesterase